MLWGGKFTVPVPCVVVHSCIQWWFETLPLQAEGARAARHDVNRHKQQYLIQSGFSLGIVQALVLNSELVSEWTTDKKSSLLWHFSAEKTKQNSISFSSEVFSHILWQPLCQPPWPLAVPSEGSSLSCSSPEQTWPRTGGSCSRCHPGWSLCERGWAALTSLYPELLLLF